MSEAEKRAILRVVRWINEKSTEELEALQWAIGCGFWLFPLSMIGGLFWMSVFYGK